VHRFTIYSAVRRYTSFDLQRYEFPLWTAHVKALIYVHTIDSLVRRWTQRACRICGRFWESSWWFVHACMLHVSLI